MSERMEIAGWPCAHKGCECIRLGTDGMTSDYKEPVTVLLLEPGQVGLSLSEKEVAQIPVLLECARKYDSRVPADQGSFELHTLIDKLTALEESTRG